MIGIIISGILGYLIFSLLWWIMPLTVGLFFSMAVLYFAMGVEGSNELRDQIGMLFIVLIFCTFMGESIWFMLKNWNTKGELR